MTIALTRLILGAATVLAVGACGSDASSDQTKADAVTPQSAVATADAFPAQHRRNLVRAFENANSGKSPTMACTGAIAGAAGSPLPPGTDANPDDVRAFELCYVDASARYIEALLAQITSGSSSDEIENTCARISSYAVITRTSIGSFAENIRLDVATLDRRLAALVDSSMTSKCPNHKASVSGAG